MHTISSHLSFTDCQGSDHPVFGEFFGQVAVRKPTPHVHDRVAMALSFASDRIVLPRFNMVARKTAQ